MIADDVAKQLREAATEIELLGVSWSDECDRSERLKNELNRRPTSEAYEAACKALHHWRAEAMRLADMAGVEPRKMNAG